MGLRPEGVLGYLLSYIDSTLKGAGALKGEKGDPGTNGKDGVTPQKGTDYWTDTDKEEVISECKSYIDSEILGGES